MPLRAVGQLAPVDQDDADHLAETERHDRQVIAAQAQDRKAEQHAEGSRQQACDRQRLPEIQPERLGEDCEAVGAHRVEGNVAEVEETGETDHDVQAPAEHDVGEDENAEVHPALVGERQHGHGDGEGDQDRRR